MQIKLARAAGMRLMLDLLKQLDPDRAGNVAVEVPDSADLRERLADLSHEIWSSWMRWQFDCGMVMPVMVGNKEIQAWVMPPSSYDRWQRQMQTPYSALSEREKDSDREQADKILVVLNSLPEPTPPSVEVA